MISDRIGLLDGPNDEIDDLTITDNGIPLMCVVKSTSDLGTQFRRLAHRKSLFGQPVGKRDTLDEVADEEHLVLLAADSCTLTMLGRRSCAAALASRNNQLVSLTPVSCPK